MTEKEESFGPLIWQNKPALYSKLTTHQSMPLTPFVCSLDMHTKHPARA